MSLFALFSASPTPRINRPVSDPEAMRGDFDAAIPKARNEYRRIA